MKALLFAMSLAAAEPTVKDRMKDVMIADRDMQILVYRNAEAIKAQADTAKSHAETMARKTDLQVALCKEAGGSKVEDCTFDYVNFTVKKK